jgi:hypothetical protein
VNRWTSPWSEQVFGGRPDDRVHAMAVYREYAESVLTAVPPGRLLVHRLGDGWPSLCAHLGVAQPAEPYPLRNTAADLQAMFEKLRAEQAARPE